MPWSFPGRPPRHCLPAWMFHQDWNCNKGSFREFEDKRRQISRNNCAKWQIGIMSGWHSPFCIPPTIWHLNRTKPLCQTAARVCKRTPFYLVGHFDIQTAEKIHYSGNRAYYDFSTRVHRKILLWFVCNFLWNVIIGSRSANTIYTTWVHQCRGCGGLWIKEPDWNLSSSPYGSLQHSYQRIWYS